MQSPPASVDARPGRYLLAIHRRRESEGERVSTGALRDALDVTGTTVTEMVRKLDDRGLVDHEKYAGVRLTDRGAAVARHLAWRFCVVTNFFTATLDTDLGAETSYEISATLPDDGLARLRELTDHPCIEECPETSQEYDGCLL